ncbi:MAG TPA: ABC transporter substrate-binding protein [Gammaproteobacteria bacterium]|nr:ABC transporter substrate-binding protein [Gammaproteobacteria bacterium]
MNNYPQRIVCLTEEPTEILYLLGEDWRIAGISGFTVRPPEARRQKPKVSAFTSAKIDKILALEPDLAVGFSDMQADIAAELIRHGVEVHIFNQRTIAEILRMICTLGGMIGCQEKAATLRARLEESVEAARAVATQLPLRPKVYFEEWDEPQISCIKWVSELIDIAGGEEIFPELAREPLGKARIVADPGEVVARAPDIIIGSWCGKKFRPEKVSARPGWDAIPAVRTGALHEIKSSIILQPGPAALTDGLNALTTIIGGWANARTSS